MFVKLYHTALQIILREDMQTGKAQDILYTMLSFIIEDSQNVAVAHLLPV